MTHGPHRLDALILKPHSCARSACAEDALEIQANIDLADVGQCSGASGTLSFRGLLVWLARGHVYSSMRIIVTYVDKSGWPDGHIC